MNILILDTSVFVKLKGAKVAPKVIEVLDRHQESRIYISEMTCFEFMRTCQNLQEVEKARQLLQIADRIPVDTDLIKFATYYYQVLVKSVRNDGKRSIATNQLSDSDIIIGATAIRSGACLCTTDRNDFPAPFFDEVSVDLIDGNQKMYVLRTDTSLFDREFERLIR